MALLELKRKASYHIFHMLRIINAQIDRFLIESIHLSINSKSVLPNGSIESCA
jgi:hypothetical protein